MQVQSFPNPATRATYSSPHTPRSRSSRSISVPNDKPPISKRRKTHRHISLDARTVSNREPSHRPSSSRPFVEAPASGVDPGPRSRTILTEIPDLNEPITSAIGSAKDRPFCRFVSEVCSPRLPGSIASNGSLGLQPARTGSMVPHPVSSPAYF